MVSSLKSQMEQHTAAHGTAKVREREREREEK